MRISDWSSDVCSSDLSGPYISKLIGKGRLTAPAIRPDGKVDREAADEQIAAASDPARAGQLHLGKMAGRHAGSPRSEEHTSELQSLMRISYAVFCLKKKKQR